MCVGLSVFPLVVNECDPPSCPCLSIAHRNSQMTASMNHIYEYFSVWEESSDFGFVTSSTAAGLSLVTENQRRVLRCSEVFQTASYLGLRCVHATEKYNTGVIAV